MEHYMISERDFIERFRPERMPDGSYYRQRGWIEPEDREAIYKAPHGCVWTVVDAGGRFMISSGRLVVDREYYVITEVPCPEGHSITVVDDDEVQCQVCGESSLRFPGNACPRCGAE